MSPKLSIVTACKNGLEYLPATVNSILDQSFKDWEWLFVDDFSSEPVQELIESQKDSRIKYFRNPSPQGQTRSLNDAIQKAQTEWIVRMDGDDIAHPDRLLKIQEATAANPHGQLIFSDYDILLQNGDYLTTVKYHHPVSSGFYDYLLTQNNPVAHPTVAFKKRSLSGELNLYDTRLKNAQDYALWKKIYLESQKAAFVHLPHSLLGYRLVPQSLSGARIKEQQMELDWIRGRRTELINPESDPTNLGQLSPAERRGMYYSRILYYSFLGQKKFSTAQILDWIKECSAYRPVLAKSLFFAMSRPLRRWVISNRFGGIYS